MHVVGVPNGSLWHVQPIPKNSQISSHVSFSDIAVRIFPNNIYIYIWSGEPLYPIHITEWPLCPTYVEIEWNPFVRPPVMLLLDK